MVSYFHTKMLNEYKSYGSQTTVLLVSWEAWLHYSCYSRFVARCIFVLIIENWSGTILPQGNFHYFSELVR